MNCSPLVIVLWIWNKVYTSIRSILVVHSRSISRSVSLEVNRIHIREIDIIWVFSLNAVVVCRLASAIGPSLLCVLVLVLLLRVIWSSTFQDESSSVLNKTFPDRWSHLIVICIYCNSSNCWLAHIVLVAHPSELALRNVLRSALFKTMHSEWRLWHGWPIVGLHDSKQIIAIK